MFELKCDKFITKHTKKTTSQTFQIKTEETKNFKWILWIKDWELEMEK